MRRSATVITAGPVSVPDSGADAIVIITDYARPDERAFYVRPDSPVPVTGEPITWGDDRAWYGGIVVRKVGYNFDPDAPLR